jgi:hypothetical protein
MDTFWTLVHRRAREEQRPSWEREEALLRRDLPAARAAFKGAVGVDLPEDVHVQADGGGLRAFLDGHVILWTPEDLFVVKRCACGHEEHLRFHDASSFLQALDRKVPCTHRVLYCPLTDQECYGDACGFTPCRGGRE